MPNEPIATVVDKVIDVAQSETFQKKPWIIACASMGFFLLLVSYIAITQKNSGEAAYKEISENQAAEIGGLKKTNEQSGQQLSQAKDSIYKLNLQLTVYKMKDSIFKIQTQNSVKDSYKK